jgi:molybdenum cofactor guanylyltransferase
MADSICGLILSGGAGRRMDGDDKGWVDFGGRPLIECVLERVRPLATRVMVSANRNLDRDPSDLDYPGPLAGIAAGLRALDDGWLLVVPCDAPHLPVDLARRLADGRGTAHAAVACVDGRVEPLFCLLSARLAASARAALAIGARSVERWLHNEGATHVAFPDARAFVNVNSRDDVRRCLA